jgi:hypothetical protein
MDILRTLGLFFNRYLAQIIVIILGSFMLYIGSQVEVLPSGEELKQNALFNYGGAALLFAGIISVLYVANFINRTIHMVLMFILLPLSVGILGYYNYRSIQDEIEFQKLIALHKKEKIQRLKDLRDAQIEYKTVHGHYANDFDSLKIFIRQGQTPIVNRIGDIPETSVLTKEQWEAAGYKERPTAMISDKDAWVIAQAGLLPGFRRDTTWKPVMEKLFMSEEAVLSRKSMYPFSIDSIDIVPFTGGKMQFIMKVDKIDKNGVLMPVILIKEPNPLVKGDTLQIGSIEEVSTSGNWGE